MNKKYLILVSLIFIFNLFLRLIFVFYGYIATEEGSMIYTQGLAYRGLLPFVDYSAWNSLVQDYIIGWINYFFPLTILSQRFIGLFIAICTLLLTLRIAKFFNYRSMVLLTLIFMTFGSYFYIYFTNVPYSEQTMTLFLLLSLFFLIKSLSSKKENFYIYLTLVLSLFTTIVRIQAFPATILIWTSIFYIFRNKIRLIILLGIISLLSNLVIIFTFLRYPDAIKYSILWPFLADKIILYQKNTVLTYKSLFVFVQDAFLYYSPLITIIFAGMASFVYLSLNKLLKNIITGKLFTETRTSREIVIISLFSSISIWFAISGLLHKPPYAAYAAVAIPIVSILASYILNVLFWKAPLQQKLFIGIFIVLLFLNHLFTFYHFAFVKTSLATVSKTPHDYLNDLALFVRNHTQPEDEVFSFFTPITVAAKRQIPIQFIRDRFAISLLNDNEAKKYHLTNTNLMNKYFSEKQATLIIFSDRNIQQLASSVQERNLLLKTIKNNYDIIFETDTLQYIETPKFNKLYVYKRKLTQ